jgi:aquaporin Z
LRVLFPQHPTFGTTVPAGAAIQSLILEMVLTAVLMFVILNVSTGPKERGTTAGIAVGSVIALEALFAGPICGASMNPARSIAPALVSQHLSNLWILSLLLSQALYSPRWAVDACAKQVVAHLLDKTISR